MNTKNDSFQISLLTNQLEVRTKENIQLKEKIEKLTSKNIKLKKENDYLKNRLLLLKSNKSNDFNNRLYQLEQRVAALEISIHIKNPWWSIPTESAKATWEPVMKEVSKIPIGDSVNSSATVYVHSLDTLF